MFSENATRNEYTITTDRIISPLDASVEGAYKALAALEADVESLFVRVEGLLREDTPKPMTDEDDLAAVRDPRSRVVVRIDSLTYQINTLGMKARSVTERLDV